VNYQKVVSKAHVTLHKVYSAPKNNVGKRVNIMNETEGDWESGLTYVFGLDFGSFFKQFFY